MKTNNKPRNYVALALMKRNGAGVHEKSNKAKRASAKRQLYKELKKPPTELGGFFIYSNHLRLDDIIIF
ncbi:MAG: hypothetical protein K2X04_07660 [Burkholderiales bacterium]|jgi:hypothetical protein|nr:hypothetical protein [Burkholderiales bacterium]